MAKKTTRRHQGSKRQRKKRGEKYDWQRIKTPEIKKPAKPGRITTHEKLMKILSGGGYLTHITSLENLVHYYGVKPVEELLAEQEFTHSEATKAVDLAQLASKGWNPIVPLPIQPKARRAKRKKRKKEVKTLRVADRAFLEILRDQHMWVTEKENFGAEENWNAVQSVHLVTPGAEFKVTSLNQKVCDQLRVLVDREKKQLNGKPMLEGKPGELQHIKIHVTVDALERFSQLVRSGNRRYLKAV